MNQSQSTKSKSRALQFVLATCLMFTSHAFQLQTQTIPQIIQSTTTALDARKGNRGASKNKGVSEKISKRQRSQVNDVLDGINSPPEFPHSVDPTDIPDGPINADPLAPLVHSIVHSADMRKASDIVAMRVTQCTSLTNFVIIVSGTSRPQNQAIASAISKDVEEEYDGKRCLGRGTPEGSADSGWILLDYGEVMVHVMTPKSRLFYDMDGQWEERGGQYMDLTDVLMDEQGNVGGLALDGGDSSADGEDEEDGLSMKERLDVEKESDPFWS